MYSHTIISKIEGYIITIHKICHYTPFMNGSYSYYIANHSIVETKRNTCLPIPLTRCSSSIVVYYETMFKYIIIQLEYHLRRLAINLIMKTKLTYFLNP